MIEKLKMWILGNVILKKVVGKFLKHGITTVAGLAGVQAFLKDSGVTVDWGKLEAWVIVATGGLVGAAWNFIQHRFNKKETIAAKPAT